MKKNLTEIVSILDHSSMSGLEDDTFSSFNAVIYEAVGEAVCNVQGRRTLYHI